MEDNIPFTFPVNFTFQSIWIEGPTNRPVDIPYLLPQTDRALARALYTIIGVTGFFSCLFVAFIISYEHKLRTRPNILLLDLLISDILFILLQLPYGIFSTQSEAPELKTTIVMFCDGFVFFFFALGITNILALAIISTDRYLSIAHPFFYQKRINHTVFCILVSWPWLQSLISTLPMALMQDWTWYGGRAEIFCMFNWSIANKYYISFLILTAVFVPLIILFFTNIQVYKIAKEHVHFMRRRSSTFTLGSMTMASDDAQWSESASTASVTRTPPIAGKKSYRNSWPRVSQNSFRDDMRAMLEKQEEKRFSYPRARAETDSVLVSKVVFTGDDQKRIPSIIIHSEQTKLTSSMPPQKRQRGRSPRSHMDKKLKAIYEHLRKKAPSGTNFSKSQNRNPLESLLYSKLQLRIVLSTYVLIAGFACSWLPFFIPRILKAAGMDIPARLSLYTQIAPMLVSLLDPVIILSCRKEIRKALAKYFKKLKKHLLNLVRR